MSNNKQSSVEWLWDKFVNKPLKISELVKLLEQAKAMHKQEMITTWHKGYDNLSPMIDEDNCGDKYYNETFGGNNEQQQTK